MVYDFDVKEFCQNLKATKPPYECPVRSCGKVYKSYCGIQFHLYNFDHDNPENNSPSPGKKPGKKKTKWGHHRAMRRSPTPPEFVVPPRRETLTYAEAQRLVEIDLEGRLHRINIYEPLEIITQDEIDNHKNTEKEEKAEKTPLKAKNCENQKSRKEVPTSAQHTIKLPEANYKVIDDYIKPNKISQRQNSYYRYIEKSSEELDEEVEYDMDEEDHAWLEILNKGRKEDGISQVKQEDFELLMDRFEKEAFFQSQTSGKDPGPSIDEDAVCNICQDGECQNSNVILFCDMCNLAVHQECYGVPYIPEGQWLCRRCLQSPSRAVDCCLCPNKGGAFKQTDDGRWAHVVCALWIPEVGFANTVFLEPIDSFDNIPPARWKLSCYICKQRGKGACIQCHKTNCYTAFHVTCAQQAGLYMKIEPIKESSANGLTVSVRKTVYCDVHTPADSDCTPCLTGGDSSDDDNKSASAKKAKEKSKLKMKKARKILAEKRNALPVVSIPIIPQSRLSKIANLISLPKKQPFLTKLLSYWTLKRQSRNGVPLLRRLQSNHMTRNKHETKNDKQSNALKEQLKYWQRLRQDLEKARLLVELIRKREKLKREQLKVHQMAMELQLQPFAVLLRSTLEQLVEKDTSNFFTEPVSLDEVPDYLDYIDKPMDFETMRKNIDNHQYRTMDEFETDFEQIIKNCMKYNAKDTVFYRAATRLRDQGGAVIRNSRRTAERVGYDPATGLHMEQVPTVPEPVVLEDVDNFLEDTKEGMPLEEQLRILLDKMDVANASRKPGKSKLARRIRKEIVKVRRKLAIQKGQHVSDIEDTADTASDINEDSAHEDGPDLSVTPKSSKSEKSSSKGSKETPTRGRGRGRGRGQVGRPRKSRNDSESESPLVGARIEKRRSSDSSRTTESSSTSSKDSNSSHQAHSGVNRRTSVLFGKKNFRSSKNDSSAPSSPGTPTQPSTPPRRNSKGGRSSKQKGDHMDSPQPPVLEPMTSGRSSSRGPASPKSPGVRKRSASAITSPDRESRPTPPKRTTSLSEPLSFADPPDITKRDSFRYYRGPDNLRSSSESDSTSVISSSDESLTDSSLGSSSSNSRSAESSKLLSSDVLLRTSVTNTPACSRTSLPASSHAKLACQPDCIEIFLSDRCDRALSLATANQGSHLLENVMGVQSYNLRSHKKTRSNRSSKWTDKEKTTHAGLSKKMKTGHRKVGKVTRKLKSVSCRNSCQKSLLTSELDLHVSGVTKKSRSLESRVAQLAKKRQDSPDLKTEQKQRLKKVEEKSSLKLDNSPEQKWVLSQLVYIKDSKLRPRTPSCDSTDSHSTNSLPPHTDTTQSSANKANVDQGRAHRSGSCDSEDLIPLEPLDLVWAKCRGYPWYPALIINPKMPKTGYFHNGVPIPVPPDDVLALQRKYDEPVYLILFFDTKRTWQWLPRNKLEPLGVDSGLDKAKLLENKKPNVRKAVQKAYEKAILHRCSVTGEPNPLSGDSELEDQD
ncbi:peregrin-like isoform X2 [Crassostrea virginica]